jgi:superoxide dismutase
MMAFAIIEHSQSYSEFYDELLDYVKRHFSQVKSGIQGDAWIWIMQDGQKVAVDTFSAMQFEIKSDDKSEFLQSVIDTIRRKYPVRLYARPAA